MENIVLSLMEAVECVDKRVRKDCLNYAVKYIEGLEGVDLVEDGIYNSQFLERKGVVEMQKNYDSFTKGYLAHLILQGVNDAWASYGDLLPKISEGQANLLRDKIYSCISQDMIYQIKIKSRDKAVEVMKGF